MSRTDDISKQLQANQELINDNEKRIKELQGMIEKNPVEVSNHIRWLNRSTKRLQKEQKHFNKELGVLIDRGLEDDGDTQYKYKEGDEKFR